MDNKLDQSKKKANHSEATVNLDESYKVIRANTMFSVLKSGCKKIVISSPSSGEGKSTTATNLAKSLSTAGLKILLIDTDLRKPTIKRKLKLRNKNGLTDFLVSNEKNDISSVLNQIENFENLFVITAGSSVPNPSDMLASQEMANLIQLFDDTFDYVIFDTPPINVVSDALYMAKLSDGVIIVVKENTSTHPELAKAIHALELIDSKILGLVLNGTRRTSKYYYSAYNYYK